MNIQGEEQNDSNADERIISMLKEMNNNINILNNNIIVIHDPIITLNANLEIVNNNLSVVDKKIYLIAPGTVKLNLKFKPLKQLISPSVKIQESNGENKLIELNKFVPSMEKKNSNEIETLMKENNTYNESVNQISISSKKSLDMEIKNTKIISKRQINRRNPLINLDKKRNRIVPSKEEGIKLKCVRDRPGIFKGKTKINVVGPRGRGVPCSSSVRVNEFARYTSKKNKKTILLQDKEK